MVLISIDLRVSTINKHDRIKETVCYICVFVLAVSATNNNAAVDVIISIYSCP